MTHFLSHQSLRDEVPLFLAACEPAIALVLQVACSRYLLNKINARSLNYETYHYVFPWSSLVFSLIFCFKFELIKETVRMYLPITSDMDFVTSRRDKSNL